MGKALMQASFSFKPSSESYITEAFELSHQCSVCVCVCVCVCGDCVRLLLCWLIVLHSCKNVSNLFSKISRYMQTRWKSGSVCIMFVCQQLCRSPWAFREKSTPWQQAWCFSTTSQLDIQQHPSGPGFQGGTLFPPAGWDLDVMISQRNKRIILWLASCLGHICHGDTPLRADAPTNAAASIAGTQTLH